MLAEYLYKPKPSHEEASSLNPFNRDFQSPAANFVLPKPEQPESSQKAPEQNLEIIRRMGELGTLGCPLLLGCSRKSVIGLTLDLPADQRLEGTLVTTVAGVLQTPPLPMPACSASRKVPSKSPMTSWTKSR